jgi:hypothetical protein
MAIVWIKEIRNYHPNGELSLRCDDGGRHPSVGGKEYGPDAWMVLKPPSGEPYSSLRPDNMAVPWSFNFTQKLWVRSTINGLSPMVTVEVRGESGWDDMVIRDDEFRELGKVDVGSQGDAPGINHSWWVLALHGDGNVEFHCLERQGLLRDEALALGRFLIDFSFDVVNSTAKAVDVIVGDKKKKKEDDAAPQPSPAGK